MVNLLTWQFWFNPRPDVLSPNAAKIMTAMIVGGVLFSIITYWLKSRGGFYRRLWGKCFNFLIANSLVALLLFFFDQELIPVFSARYWYLIWLVCAIAWLVFIVLHFKKMPAIKRELNADQLYKKYLP